MPRATFGFVLALSLTVSARETLAPFVPPNASTTKVRAFDRHLLWGRTDAWEGAPDFFCRQSDSHSNVIHPLSDGTPKCYAKGMVLGDIGDAPDLVLRRAGPDGAAYNARPQQVPEGTSLGTLYWQAWTASGRGAAATGARRRSTLARRASRPAARVPAVSTSARPPWGTTGTRSIGS
jgi:hypothetical protein